MPGEPTRLTGPAQVGIISPCYNEAESLEEFLKELLEVCDRVPDVSFRVLVIDDGSEDESAAIVEKAGRRDPRIEVHRLSRNFGHQVALSAGLDLASGDAVIMLDSDLQHPPTLIPQMIARWREGFDVVSAVRDRTADASLLKRASSGAFYRLLARATDTEIVAGAADFCLLSKVAHQALRRMPERHRFLRGMVSWIGFRRTHLHYRAPKRRHGRTKYTTWKMFRLALDGLFSFSVWPLRIIGQVGAAVAALGCAYLAYVVCRFAFYGDTVRGWPSLISTVLVLGGLQLLALGMVGEYLARVYEESKARPLYFLRDEGQGREPRQPRDERIGQDTHRA
jgi:glycosyltransferase involved in cell wall biosynthesis